MTNAVLTSPLKAVGDYTLIEKIGEGGMGAVYKARKQDTGEVVAVKLLPPDKSSSSMRLKRFEQEFRAAQRLDHPNIVKVIDFGTAGAMHYMVMELVEGPSLGAHLAKHGRLKEADAVDIILQIAQALHQAHRAGLVHRDVKPDNILLAPNGLAKLTDLGLVKVLDEHVELTRTNSGLGTPNFMAPEQFNNAKRADPRCDIYSLGATLYMCITGQVPFRATSPLNVLKKKTRGELAPLNLLAPGTSERVERVVVRSMHLDPQQRHATCQEFIADLTGKSLGRTVHIRRVEEKPPLRSSEFSGKERRKQKRFPSRQEGRCLPLAGHKEDEWTARVCDVSTTGMGLMVNRRFEPGTVLVVRLKGATRARPNHLVVRVVRQQAQGRRCWLLGCQFPRPLSDEEMRDLV